MIPTNVIARSRSCGGVGDWKNYLIGDMVTPKLYSTIALSLYTWKDTLDHL